MADDVAEGLEGFAEVEGDEFGGGLGLEGGESGDEMGFDAFEATFVSGVDGDGMIEGEGAASEDDGADGVAKFGEAGAILAGDGDGARTGLPIRVQGEVGFVEDEEVAVLGGWGEGDAGGGGGGLAGVDDFEDEVGAFEFGLGALDADAFDVVEAFAEAGGVDEAEGDAVDLDDFFDGVAGGSGGGADDGAFEAEEAVEEAAFADVGFANDDGAGAVSEDAALFRGIEQGAGAGEELIEAGLEGGAGVGGDVFLGEVDVGFDVGEDVDKRGAEGFGFATDGTGELFVGGADGEGALGVDEVHDGLGLGEVHFAVKEGALGEFAGFGRAGTGLEEGFEDALGDEQAAVALELDGVFAGVAGGVVEEDGDALVEGQVVVVAGFDEVDSARGEGVEREAMMQDPGADFKGLRA